jgi:hypothetical protein
VYKQEHSHAGSKIEDQQIVDNIESIYICSAKSIAIYFEKKELLWWLGSCAGPRYNTNPNFPEHNLDQINYFTRSTRAIEKGM